MTEGEKKGEKRIHSSFIPNGELDLTGEKTFQKQRQVIFTKRQLNSLKTIRT